MQDVLQILLWYLGFYLIVAVHEFGHYIIGKAMKFKCSEFSVGIGPTFFKKEISGTKFSFKAIPLGGICTFDDFIKEHKKGENVRGFYLKKALVILGGPIFNIFLVLVLTLCMNNVEVLRLTAVNEPQLSSVSISEGDIVRNINDIRIYSERDIEELLIAGTDNTITILNSDYEKETVSFYCENTHLDLTYDISFRAKLMGAFRNYGKFIDTFSEAFTGDQSIIDEMGFSNLYSSLDHEAEIPFSFSRTYNGAVMITIMLSLVLGLMNLLPVVFFDGFKVILSLICAAANRGLSKAANIVVAVLCVALTAAILF